MNSIKNNKQTETSALTKYALENSHRLDFTNVKILAAENDYHKRLVLQIQYIKKDENSENNRHTKFDLLLKNSIGLYFLPQRQLTDDSSTNFLKEELPGLFEEILLQLR